jgi:hypothetical protein
VQDDFSTSDFPLEQKAVIPAKAGIQFIEKCLRSRSTLVPCPLRGLFFLLDSRLRGNDGSNGKSGLNHTQLNPNFKLARQFDIPTLAVVYKKACI